MDNMENTVMTEEANKPYTLRPLRDEDLWPILNIIGKVVPADLSFAFVDLITEQKTVEEIGYDVGFKLVVAIIKNLPVIGDELYDFLANVSGVSAEEVRKMKFGTTPKMIWDVYHDIKNSDFFEVFSK